MPQSSDIKDTRQRLIEAAGEVFAEVGFNNATVRDICEKAEANVAAIHYHFGDKEALYRAVFRYAYEQAMLKNPVTTPELQMASPEEQLRFFIQSFVSRILDDGRPSWHGQLMSREMIERTGALEEVIEYGIRPQHQVLIGILRSMIGEDASEEDLYLMCGSIIGNCVFYHHARPVLEMLCSKMKFDKAFREKLADHIYRFSIAAITGYCSLKEDA